MTMKRRKCSIGSNPLQLPLDRGRDRLAPPLLRGGWEGFESVMIYGNINNSAISKKNNYFQSGNIFTASRHDMATVYNLVLFIY